MRIDGVVQRLEGEPVKLDKKFKHTIDVVIDRVVLKASATSRIAESVETATKLSDGRVVCIWLMKRPKKPTGRIDSGLHDGMAGRPFLLRLP